MHPNNYPNTYDYGDRNLKHNVHPSLLHPLTSFKALLGNVGLTPKMSLHQNPSYYASNEGYANPNQYPKYQSTQPERNGLINVRSH